MAKRKFLVFGGEALPEGTHTYYDRINSDGTFGGETAAHPGHKVPVERVGKINGYKADGSEDLIENASEFIDRKMARVVEEDAVEPKKEPAPVPK